MADPASSLFNELRVAFEERAPRAPHRGAARPKANCERMTQIMHARDEDDERSGDVCEHDPSRGDDALRAARGVYSRSPAARSNPRRQGRNVYCDERTQPTEAVRGAHAQVPE